MAETSSSFSHLAIPIESSISSDESLASSFETMMNEKLNMSPNCCIFKIPRILYRHNEAAYNPNAFSIGPFRHGEEQLIPTQRIKQKYLQDLIRRSKTPKEKLIRQLIASVKEVELEARECYAGPVRFDSDKFVEMLVLDGCFIIELFRKDANEVTKDPDDPIFTMSCLLQFLSHDLILLENQIPWLVLEKLFSLTKVPGDKLSLIQLSLDFFGNMFSSYKPNIEPDKFKVHKIKHILDLLRHSLLIPLDPDSDKQVIGWQPIPSATKISEAGIKFKKVMSDTILDIKFNHGFLEIPPLLIQETTDTIIRNLISFEQCCPNYPPRITSYAKLMDNIIDTSKDVEILCEKEVLDNWLNPEDVTQSFNKLCNDAYVKQYFYVDLSQQVNTYCQNWWPRWRFFYLSNYFGKPWVIVSQVVAAILLILTFLGTFFTVLTYVKDHPNGKKGS